MTVEQGIQEAVEMTLDGVADKFERGIVRRYIKDLEAALSDQKAANALLMQSSNAISLTAKRHCHSNGTGPLITATGRRIKMSERQRDPEVAKKPAYISYCRRCGGMTGCCADNPQNAKSAAEFVSECIAGGLIIERKTAADVWAATWCECPELMRGEPQQVQAGLFEEAQP